MYVVLHWKGKRFRIEAPSKYLAINYLFASTHVPFLRIYVVSLFEPLTKLLSTNKSARDYLKEICKYLCRKRVRKNLSDRHYCNRKKSTAAETSTEKTLQGGIQRKKVFIWISLRLAGSVCCPGTIVTLLPCDFWSGKIHSPRIACTFSSFPFKVRFFHAVRFLIFNFSQTANQYLFSILFRFENRNIRIH